MFASAAEYLIHRTGDPEPVGTPSGDVSNGASCASAAPQTHLLFEFTGAHGSCLMSSSLEEPEKGERCWGQVRRPCPGSPCSPWVREHLRREVRGCFCRSSSFGEDWEGPTQLEQVEGSFCFLSLGHFTLLLCRSDQRVSGMATFHLRRRSLIDGNRWKVRLSLIAFMELRE